MSGERISTVLLRKVDSTGFIMPVDSVDLNFRNSQPSNETNFIKENALCFQATDLMVLGEVDIYKLSGKLENLFKRISWKLKIKSNSTISVMFGKTDKNCLKHELAHLGKMEQISPEVIPFASVNILPVIHKGLLMATSILATPQPTTPYSILQHTEIIMAPVSPSAPDYLALISVIKANKVLNEDIEFIRQIIANKPDTEIGSKEELLTVLNSINNG